MASITNGKCTKTEKLAELVVRRFFEHYLNDIFPKQLAEVITTHNNDVNAHSEQIKTKVDVAIGRLKLWVIGLVFAAGLGSGAGIAKFFLPGQ